MTKSSIPMFRPYMLKLLDEAKEDVLKKPRKNKIIDILRFILFYFKHLNLERAFYLELTPVEEEEKRLRIASFNKFEKFIWKYTPGYKTTFLWALFMSLFIPIIMISGKVWNLIDPVPLPFDMNWGRRHTFPQYIYLLHNNRRIAKTRVGAHMDNYYTQPILECVNESLFALPGILMPFWLYLGVYHKRRDFMIYWLAWLCALIIRTSSDIIIFAFRFFVTPDFKAMYHVAFEKKIPLWYLYFRHTITFIPAITSPILIWIAFCFIAHYRSIYRVISKDKKKLNLDMESLLLNF